MVRFWSGQIWIIEKTRAKYVDRDIGWEQFPHCSLWSIYSEHGIHEPLLHRQFFFAAFRLLALFPLCPLYICVTLVFTSVIPSRQVVATKRGLFWPTPNIYFTIFLALTYDSMSNWKSIDEAMSITLTYIYFFYP